MDRSDDSSYPGRDPKDPESHLVSDLQDPAMDPHKEDPPGDEVHSFCVTQNEDGPTNGPGLDSDPMTASACPESGEKDKESKSCLCPKLGFFHKGMTRPNYKYMSLMFVALFSSSFTLTFLFPFLPDMVKWMGYSEEEKGYYVGLIASSVFAGRACGSFFWGWLSDIKGRKLVLLLTIAGNGIFSLLFGLSVNLPMALVFRFMAGVANGTVGTAKTVLYEISDTTNQAIGMSVISLAWGCGLILGPTIGGVLASPTVKYPSVFSAEGFFAQYPFFLPSLVTLMVCCVGFTITLLKFKETLQKNVYDINITETDTGLDEGKPLTYQGSISASQINICRSIESLHRGPLAAMSIEDVHCAAEAESYFTYSENSMHANKCVKSSSVSSLDKTDLTPRREAVNGKNVCTVECEESVETGLLNENEVRTFFNMDKNISATSLHRDAELTASASDWTKDDCGDQNGGINEIGQGNIVGQGHEVDLDHSKQDSVTIVYERQMTSVKLKKKSKTRSLSACCSSFWHTICKSKMVSLLGVSDIRNSILLYSVFSFGVIGSEDVFTVFLSTDPRYNGLGFDSNEIGLSLGVVAVPLLFLQLIVFPLLVKKLEIKKTFLLGGIVLVITVQCLAMLHPLHDNPVVLWTLLLLILLPERLSVNCCFSGTSLMVNNSCDPQNAGTVNGIAMTITAIARTLAPTIGGSIFAWSISYGADHLGPPFDHNLVFIVFGFVFFISVIECLLLPERLNRQTKKT